MNREPHYSSFLSTFTVNIIFVVLIIVGAAMIPLLSLQLNPTRYLPSLTISYSWPETPARVVEQEVTTILEGIMTTVTGVSKISSSTFNEGGNIRIEFDSDADLITKRFEVASLVRESRKRLPEAVSYPEITMNMPSNQSGSTILSFQLNGNASPSYIYDYAEKVVKPAIAMVEGVYNVVITGATPQEWEIEYDQQKLTELGINSSEIKDAINTYLLENELGGASETLKDGSGKMTFLTLKGNVSDIFRWDDVPLAKVSGRIIHLTDVARIWLNDQRPLNYFRINGLNTVNIRVEAGKNVNNITTAKDVKKVMKNIATGLPAGYSVRTQLDNTISLKEEITKNIFRAILSVILLLLFVLAISRELKYLLIITISLVANILIAFIFYYIFKLEIHLYSLAGITVSFGIIINNTIVMTDHIRFRHNRKVGITLLAATLTTIGALMVIFFLDETSKVTLSDFAAVVIINLSVSLGVALFFIPSLIEKIGLKPVFNALAIKRKRRVVRLSASYLKGIEFILKYRTVFIIAALLLFGLPFFFLPDTLPSGNKTDITDEKRTAFQKLYNKTLGNEKYVKNVKPVVNIVSGGTLRLFSGKVKNGRFYYSSGQDESPRTRITVNIGLSEEGLTIEDMNRTCTGLENMLAAYKEIDLFTTTINSAEDAVVVVTFKPEYDLTIFPYSLKAKIEDYMTGIGSYHSSVYGMGDVFSNNVGSDNIITSYMVIMRGYNYDNLYSFSESLRDRLIESGRGRIKEVYLLGGNYTISRGSNRKVYRNIMEMDKNFLAMNGSDISSAFTEAQKYSRGTNTVTQAYINGERKQVNIKSKQSEQYDQWAIENIPIQSGTGGIIKLKDFSSVTREVTDNTISRENQQYIITVGFDFIGNRELGNVILKRNIDETNSMLPLGYTAESGSNTYSWDTTHNNYFLLFLVILIIYFVCAILLESFSQPFVVICLIPFSFIGVFITFQIFNISADEGVFAAMILLCGIVVNATLYILNDYNSIRYSRPSLPERIAYVKAFNGKIIPIFLTKLSTIIGLVPFLLTGKDERFWFALAAGTIGGLVFSFIGLFVFQPMMLRRGEQVCKGDNYKKM
jgi:multidrug efflux pump subunit AcrB